MTEILCDVRIGTSSRLGVKNTSSHAHKTGSWYLSRVLFKISDERSRPFYMAVLSPGTFLSLRIQVYPTLSFFSLKYLVDADTCYLLSLLGSLGNRLFKEKP